jgi:hypothetical protein
VEDRFDVVPVRVNDERCVIPGVVMRAKTRRAVVAATASAARVSAPASSWTSIDPVDETPFEKFGFAPWIMPTAT